MHRAVDFTPHDGTVLRHRCVTTLLRGVTVWNNGRVLEMPGHERFLKRSTTAGTNFAPVESR